MLRATENDVVNHYRIMSVAICGNNENQIKTIIDSNDCCARSTFKESIINICISSF